MFLDSVFESLNCKQEMFNKQPEEITSVFINLHNQRQLIGRELFSRNCIKNTIYKNEHWYIVVVSRQCMNILIYSNQKLLLNRNKNYTQE